MPQLMEVRFVFHALEQWDGSKWNPVPNLTPGQDQRGGKMHFDVEDCDRSLDAVERALNPNR